MKTKDLICPISNVKVPEHLPRVTAFFNIILMSAFIYNPNIYVLMLIGAEFLLRGFGYQQFSIIHFLAVKTSTYFQFKSKNIDRAPKAFAARLGGIFTMVAFLLFLLGFTTSSVVVVAMVGVLSTLECAFGLCVGCYIYTYLVLPVYK